MSGMKLMNAPLGPNTVSGSVGAVCSLRTRSLPGMPAVRKPACVTRIFILGKEDANETCRSHQHRQTQPYHLNVDRPAKRRAINNGDLVSSLDFNSRIVNAALFER